MTKKPTTLSGAMSKKAAAPVAAVASAPPPAEGKVLTLTLRLAAPVHDQLRELAFTSRKSQQALLLDALNLLFEQHGKPPIAA